MALPPVTFLARQKIGKALIQWRKSPPLDTGSSVEEMEEMGDESFSFFSQPLYTAVLVCRRMLRPFFGENVFLNDGDP